MFLGSYYGQTPAAVGINLDRQTPAVVGTNLDRQTPAVVGINSFEDKLGQADPCSSGDKLRQWDIHVLDLQRGARQEGPGVVKVAYGLLLDKQTAPRFCFPPSSRQCVREGGCSRSVLSPFPHPRLAQEATPRLVVCPRAVKETCGWPRTAAHFTVRNWDGSRDGSHFRAGLPSACPAKSF